MRRGIYFQLAVTNLVKNRKIYIPYLLTCICSIAMYYMIYFMRLNPELENMRGGVTIRTILGVGSIVIGLFSVIFLVYSNGFLMRQRKKELGLYNILGMEKRHIRRMLLLEMLLTAAMSLGAGILLGILGGKLLFLLLLRLIQAPVQFGFYISGEAILHTFFLFGIIFGVTLLNDLRQIHLVNPIELLQGSKAGEKEPKGKWLMAVIGLVCLVAGYYIAWTTKTPLKAVNVFFAAVLLVMAGTYLLFTSGSIVFLKLLRRKKKFYYQTRHFTSVSGLIYRMKQNAVGLANICILSTGVLLMISTTICLYFGTENFLKSQYPSQINVVFQEIEKGQESQITDTVEQVLESQNMEGKIQYQVNMVNDCILDGDEIQFERQEQAVQMDNIGILYFFTQEEYSRITGEERKPLANGEVLIYETRKSGIKDRCILGGKTYSVQKLESFPFRGILGDIVPSVILVGNDTTCAEIEEAKKMEEGKDINNWECNLWVDLTGDSAQKERLVSREIEKALRALAVQSGFSGDEGLVQVASRQENVQRTWELNGGLLFLGLFLGSLFLLGTVLIIYYKQVSEGYEDRERYEIMQKVGMNKKEVQQSIRSQILMVFFLPLFAAVCHIVVAFQLIRRLMEVFYMSDVWLFAGCTAGTTLVFAVLYVLIYVITARVYYKIVE